MLFAAHGTRMFALRRGALRGGIACSRKCALFRAPSVMATERPSRGMAERSVTERRIKRMLELEKEAQSKKGMQEVQTRERMLTFPETDSELEDEVAQFDDPREHPAFWKMTADGVLLFERNTRDRYRNLRILLGSSGPPCGVGPLHRLLDLCVASWPIHCRISC